MKAPLDLNNHRLIICLGSGGVGKTTISAALALYGAMEGRSVDVMTVTLGSLKKPAVSSLRAARS